MYAIAIIPLILRAVTDLKENKAEAKAAGYADDLFSGGKLEGLRKLWSFIEEYGPGYGYYQQAEKTWIIVKEEYRNKAEKIFAGTGIKITNDGKKHLGAAIGSETFRNEYINKKIDTWIQELTLLSKIAAFAPHEAYACFTSGYKHKLKFCMRTIPGISKDLKRLDEIVTTKLIPAITGGIQPNEDERKLFSLAPSLGGLGIHIFNEIADIEFKNSMNISTQLQNNITLQEPTNNINSNETKKRKTKSNRTKSNETTNYLKRL